MYMNIRNVNIDIAKGLGIILVVIGHSHISQNIDYLHRLIFSFHMPFFYVVAGIYIDRKSNISSFVVSKASALLKPYVFVLTSLGLFKLMVELGSQNPSGYEFIDYFKGVLYATGATITWVPLWFLPNLFVTLICSLLLLKISKIISNSLILMLFCAIALLVVGIYNINYYWRPVPPPIPNLIGVWGLPGLPLSIDLLPITSAFVIFGYALKDSIKSMSPNIYGLTLSAIAFSLLQYFFGQTIDLNMRVYGSPIISTVQALLGVYIILNLAAYVAASRFVIIVRSLAYSGTGSLFILLFHNITYRKCHLVLSMIGVPESVNEICAILLAILIPLLLYSCSRKHKVF